MNSHQRVTSAEEYANNQEDRTTHSTNVSSLSPQQPLSSLNVLMNTMATVAGMEVCTGSAAWTASLQG